MNKIVERAKPSSTSSEALERLLAAQEPIPCQHGLIGSCVTCNPGVSLSVALKRPLPGSAASREDASNLGRNDSQLISRWLAAQPLTRRGGVARWEVVAELFSLMEPSARQVCQRHGFDPEERVLVRSLQ